MTDESLAEFEKAALDGHAKLVRRTWSTGIQALLMGGFLVVVERGGLALLNIEPHWSLKLIAVVAAVLNLVAFILKVRLLRKKKRKCPLSGDLTVTGNRPANRTSENHMDDPEVRELMDRLAKKSRQ